MNYIQKPNFNQYPVVKNLLIANIVMFALTYLIRSTQNIDLDGLLGLHYFEAGDFKPHQFITFLFMHANLMHIFFNMYGLWIFGQILENYWGSKRFFTYYMICGIGSGLTQQVAWYFYLHHDPSLIALPHEQLAQLTNPIIAIGASGAIFGLLLAFGMIFPNVPLYIMFIPVPIKAKWLVIGYGLYELFMGAYNSSGDNVAHFAHIGGIIFGFILIMIWRKRGTTN
jgi:membrane associated rhomboid family serine protease